MRILFDTQDAEENLCSVLLSSLCTRLVLYVSSVQQSLHCYSSKTLGGVPLGFESCGELADPRPLSTPSPSTNPP